MDADAFLALPDASAFSANKAIVSSALAMAKASIPMFNMTEEQLTFTTGRPPLKFQLYGATAALLPPPPPPATAAAEAVEVGTGVRIRDWMRAHAQLPN